LKAATGPAKARIRKIADLKTGASGFTVEEATKDEEREGNKS
jgi:hypothetical protein